ncbi:MAG: glycosyltransferase family 39 protein [Geitlerinemataceae cyanobacterium]
MNRSKWLKFVCIALLVLGIILRFTNLGLKFYWDDEVRTSMRISGYTLEQIETELYINRPISAEVLKKYHFPSAESSLKNAIEAFTQHPEHPPLYYLSARFWTQFWMQWFNDSVAVTRSLSALFSVLALPCIYWLCWELFESASISWMSVAIVAISPLHVLYAYEARQYSLWTVTILLSSAVLLRSIRLTKQNNSNATFSWLFYSFSLVLGLYSHLLFTTVTIGQGLYTVILEKFKFSKVTIAYGFSLLGGLIAFSPWIWIAISKPDRTGKAIAEAQTNPEFSYLVNRWFRNLNRVFLNGDLGGANILFLLITLYAIYFICCHTPPKVWLFILTLIGTHTLAVVIPDLAFGGTRSAGLRYLFPVYIGIQLVFAYCFAMSLLEFKTRSHKFWSAIAIAILLVGTITSAIESQKEITWSKSDDKAKYYIPTAQAINLTPKSLIVSDAPPVEILTLSYRLDPQVHLQLSSQPNFPQIPPVFSPIFLFNPSQVWKKEIEENPNLELKVIVQRREEPDRSFKLFQLIRR